MINQKELISDYDKKSREPFNEYLFYRNDMDIVEELKKVILSSQREGFFTVRVESFTVIDDYAEINKLLFDYNEKYKSKNKNRRKENIYDYVNLKDSDVRLLIVKYFIAIKDESEYINVFIEVPRIVDKYYLRINGNMYSTMFQIVDGSTYNNLTSNSKYSSVTMKTMFMPIRVYRYSDNFYDINGETIKAQFYVTRVFNKSNPGMKYFLAKFGFEKTIQFLGLEDIYLSKDELVMDNYYTFKLQNGSYLLVGKSMMDNDSMTQSFVHAIIKSVKKDVIYDDVFSDWFWVQSLGADFNNQSIEKGESILNSLESIYDQATKDSIKLPEEYKKDIYDIIRWMMREFSYLRQKDNLDISYKKIRLAEYIASLYAAKISKGIYRISDMKNRAGLSDIKKALTTHPTYLLSAIDKCNLVNYRNMVNDMDSLVALKCTYKGISGLGENGSNAIPDIYRCVNISHIKRVDLDSSSATDPGISGTVCPYTDIYDNGYFSDYKEPNYWGTEYTNILDIHKKLTGQIQVLEFRNKVLGENRVEEQNSLMQTAVTMEQLIKPFIVTQDAMNEDNKVYLEEGGIIYYGNDQ